MPTTTAEHNRSLSRREFTHCYPSAIFFQEH